MLVKIILDQLIPPNEVHLLTAEISEEILAIKEQIENPQIDNVHHLKGWQEEKVLLIKPQDVISIYTEDNGVFALTLYQGTCRLKERIYQLEKILSANQFVRISQGELVNFDYVESLNLKISGTIELQLSTGAKSYASRRYVAKVKEYLGM